MNARQKKVSDNMSDYYVYVYIDPRNMEEFYYGKGKGNRSQAHLLDQGRSKKTTRIKQIKAEGIPPTIRIVAKDLTEEQALLVETTLIWKLGKRLTNKNSGRYAAKFRPQNTLHKKLPGFDFSRGIHYVDVGDPWRSWEDCRRHGFLSAGYGVKFSNQIKKLRKGDTVVAYLRKHGYVGIGRVTEEAVPARDFRIGKKTLKQLHLRASDICHHFDNLKKCEYVVRVRWLIAKSRRDYLWKRKYGLFAARLVRASLADQRKTLNFIESEWGVKFEDILE